MARCSVEWCGRLGSREKVGAGFSGDWDRRGAAGDEEWCDELEDEKRVTCDRREGRYGACEFDERWVSGSNGETSRSCTSSASSESSEGSGSVAAGGREHP